jgi:hypothetical protein
MIRQLSHVSFGIYLFNFLVGRSAGATVLKMSYETLSVTPKFWPETWFVKGRERSVPAGFTHSGANVPLVNKPLPHLLTMF